MGIAAHIKRFAWRMRAAIYLRWLSRCMLCAVMLISASIAADKIIFFGFGLFIPSLIILGICAPLAAILAAVLDPVTVVRAAQVVDREAGLEDRLVSAATLPAGGPWRDAVEADAIHFIKGIPASVVMPLRATLAARLIVPAGIILALALVMPQMDVFGRRNKKVIEDGNDAASAQQAISVFAQASGEGSEEEPPQTLGALRVSLVRIEREFVEKNMESARMAELADRLRKLSSAMMKAESGSGAAESIKRAAEALARGDAGAAAALQAAQAELEKLERALERALAQDNNLLLKPNIDKAAVQVSSRNAQSEAGTEDLIELPSSGRNSSQPLGLTYTSRTGTVSGNAEKTYEKAVRDLNVMLESQQIPIKYLPLVKSYFESIKPANEN